MADAVFFVFAAVSLLSAVLVVASRSVVHSALYLVVSFLAVAGLFILQGAEFLGAVQILLYAGSIVVMFVFVVMMVNLKEVLGPQWASLRSIGGLLRGLRLLSFGARVVATHPVDNQPAQDQHRYATRDVTDRTRLLHRQGIQPLAATLFFLCHDLTSLTRGGSRAKP